MEKKKVAYIYDPAFNTFDYGSEHPMKPQRIGMTHELIESYQLLPKLQVYKSPSMEINELLEFHDEKYLQFLQKVNPENEEQFSKEMEIYNPEEDCPIFKGLFEYSCLQAGSSKLGAKLLNDKEVEIAINWSGGYHHARKSQASGFCFVNDIVLAIQELLKHHTRVLYIDIDIHHGDGVETAFFSSNRVMTCSFHKYEDDWWPYTGKVSRIGTGKGENYSVNVPLKDNIDDEQYIYIFKKTMKEVIDRFQPNAIVMQCGCDTLAGDIIGDFNLTLEGPAECVRFIRQYNLPLLVLGGGGYTPKNVARCWTYLTSLLIDGKKLEKELPENIDRDIYGPNNLLYIDKYNRENKNSFEELDNIYTEIHNHLKNIEIVTSVENLIVSTKKQLKIK
ncbi:histone deacetylase [Anaeramoeba flamelloides]|uniref:Histone deacetylase n=1 Tax=Anaeramoeba flamelloides TaxID=1746091 RepID=A0AAV7Y5Z1_9EUKA|nr:histone deacetylase [Anaeramoeba flamelloides]